MTKSHHIAASDTISEKGSEDIDTEKITKETPEEVYAEGHNGDSLITSVYNDTEENDDLKQPELDSMIDNFSDVYASESISGEFVYDFL